MGTYEFILKLMDIIAIPGAVVLVVWILRDRITHLSIFGNRITAEPVRTLDTPKVQIIDAEEPLKGKVIEDSRRDQKLIESKEAE